LINKGPLNVTIFATNKCNFKCWFCKRTSGVLDTSKDVSLELAEYILKTFTTIEGVCIAGFGEPLMYKNIVELCILIHKYKKALRISTNGSLLKKYSVTDLQRMFVHEYSISLNAVNPKKHSETHGVPESVFHDIIDGIYYIKEKCPKSFINLTFVISKRNYMDIPDMIKFGASLNCTMHFFNLLPHDMRYMQDVISVEDYEIISELNKFRENMTYAERQLVLSWVTPINPKKYRRGCCNCSYFHMLVSPEGYISGCVRMEPPRKEFGSVYDKDVWYNEHFSFLRNPNSYNKNCKFCMGYYKQYKL